MIKFKELIKNLRAFTILIVENDFTYIENSEEIVGRLCLSKSKIPMISEKLRLGGYKDVENKMNAFFDNLDQIGDSHDLTLLEKIGPSSFNHYLDKINKSGIANDLMSIIKEEINDDNSNEFKNIFFNSGILDFESLGDYNDIIKIINSIPDCQIIFRKEYPSEDKIDELLQELEITFRETKSNFCLSIIDKLLGRGDEGGRELIETIIQAHKQQNELKHICCLYTSKPRENLSLNSYEEYFIQEVKKNSNIETINKITSILAQCAYAEVFNSLRLKTIESAEKTLQIVLKNQKNIKYIIDKSHEEGIPPYDAIKYWNTLSIQNEFDIREIENFRFIASLTSLFNENYLENHPNFSDVGQELKMLNSFELFDYNVNKKYLSIAPGDIWQDQNGDYYILVGQLCDLLLRKESNIKDRNRNALIGELFKIEFGKPKNSKFEIDITNGRKSIYIDHFYETSSKEYKTIRIDVSTPNIRFADLKVLDLAMYNDTGICDIDLHSTLDEAIIQLLPINRDLYYESIKAEYKDIDILNDEQMKTILALDSLDFSKLKFSREGDTIKHGIKRICRLKGRYFDSLYNNYLNHKGRIDLNLIENTNEVSEVKTSYCQFGNSESSKKIIKLNVYTNRNGRYIMKSDLARNLPSEFTLLADYFDDEIQLSDKRIAEIIEIEDTLQIKFRYRINEKTVAEISMEDFDFRFLFKDNQNRYKDRAFYEEGKPEILKSFANSKISINELLSGIIIPDINEKVIIINGCLKKEKIEE